MEQALIYFKIFAHNIPVRGKQRSAIYDLQKGKITLIPNVLYDIIQDLSKQPLLSIKHKYAPQNPELFDNYIDFLLKKDLGFKTKTPEDFPDLVLDYDIASDIYSAVIESDFKNYDINTLIDCLNELLCQYLEVRLDIKGQSREDVLDFINRLNGKTFRSVVLIIEYCPELWYDDWAKTFFEACPKIEKIIIVNCPIKFNSESYMQQIIFSPQTLTEVSKYKERHIVNQHYFMEALHFNPFYNRKVCVDNQGNIKNDLRQKEAFGIISKSSNLQHELLQVIKSEAFRERWYASPDSIEGIKDSELRYCQFLPFLISKNKNNDWILNQSLSMELSI